MLRVGLHKQVNVVVRTLQRQNLVPKVVCSLTEQRSHIIPIGCIGIVGVAAVTSWSLSPRLSVDILLVCTFNLGSSISDCYTVWKLGALPPGSLLYTTDYRTVAAIFDTHESE